MSTMSTPPSGAGPPLRLPRTKRLDRRIPKEQRRRAAASCDYCKRKRNKCERPEGDDFAPCKACRDNGFECRYTIPRKRRVSSDVPGKRKYEYVDATFYRHESTYGLPKLTSRSSSLTRTDAALATPVSGEAVDPASQPTASSASPTAATAASYTTNYASSTALDDARASSSPPPAPALPASADIGGPPAPTPTGLASASAGAAAPHPGWPPGDSAQGPPPFMDRFHYIGFHGSYSFLVQVRSLFSEAQGGGEGHTMAPQTMGSGNCKYVDGAVAVLPDRQFADTLVNSYFAIFNRDRPLLHHATFQEVYEHLWQGRAVGSSWLVCVYMVFVFGIEGCTSSVDVESRDQFQERYTGLVRGLLPDVLSGAALVDIQALLIYGMYMFFHGQRDYCWNLSGSAVRMAQAIGLHRGDAADLRLKTVVERELRKRVFWQMYILERFECSSLGRPPSIDNFDCTVEYPRDEALDAEHEPQDGLMAHMRAEIDLCTILGQITKRFYVLDHPATAENLQSASQFYDQLLLWREQLPPQLRRPPTPTPSPPPRAAQYTCMPSTTTWCAI
jgi:proline utilization trans-activator